MRPVVNHGVSPHYPVHHCPFHRQLTWHAAESTISWERQGILASKSLRQPVRQAKQMNNRISTCRSLRDYERIQHARDTIDFCQAMLQILAQTGDVDDAELIALKAMQRPALAIVLEYSAWTDWP